MIRLYDSRDKRLEELAERGKAFEKETMARWPRLDLLAQYGEFFSDAWSPPISQEERPLWDALCGRKREMLEKKRVAAEDLAPLLLMAQRIFGLPRRDIRHTVIDEAQDFSPLQFWLLRELTGNTSFTIVGDLMQGVHAWEGIEAWEEITGPVFDGRVTLHPLRTSYRSTMEIMLFASRVARKRPVPGQQLARPCSGTEKSRPCTPAQAFAPGTSFWPGRRSACARRDGIPWPSSTGTPKPARPSPRRCLPRCMPGWCTTGIPAMRAACW